MKKPYYKNFIRTKDELRECFEKYGEMDIDFDVMHKSYRASFVCRIRLFNIKTRRWSKPSMYAWTDHIGIFEKKEEVELKIDISNRMVRQFFDGYYVCFFNVYSEYQRGCQGMNDDIQR